MDMYFNELETDEEEEKGPKEKALDYYLDLFYEELDMFGPYISALHAENKDEETEEFIRIFEDKEKEKWGFIIPEDVKPGTPLSNIPFKHSGSYWMGQSIAFIQNCDGYIKRIEIPKSILLNNPKKAEEIIKKEFNI